MYERLLSEAEDNDLEVICQPLKGKIKGLYCDKVIVINSNLPTTAEKTCVLAEELGHHFTSCGNILNTSVTVNRKQEVKARRWAVKRLVSFDGIIQAFKAGCRNMYEVAEHIGVTEEFLRQAFETYSQIYGNYKEYGRYVIYFDPPGVFERRENG